MGERKQRISVGFIDNLFYKLKFIIRFIQFCTQNKFLLFYWTEVLVSENKISVHNKYYTITSTVIDYWFTFLNQRLNTFWGNRQSLTIWTQLGITADVNHCPNTLEVLSIQKNSEDWDEERERELIKWIIL